MDHSVDKYRLLPEITFGDFSEEDSFRFFRVDRTPVASSKHSTKMAHKQGEQDDNPFTLLANSQSNDSLTDQVNTLNLASSKSFPALQSTDKNTNRNNDGDGKSGQSTSESNSSNLFAPKPSSSKAQEMEQESGDPVSKTSINSTHNSSFITPNSSSSKTGFTGLGASPSSLKRRTRSSTNRTSVHNLSGVILRSRSLKSSSSKQKVSKNKTWKTRSIISNMALQTCLPLMIKIFLNL